MLHGYIYGLLGYSEENASAVFALPREDDSPYLTFDLFAVPRIDLIYDDLLVTFGNVYKNLFPDSPQWEVWRGKFEALSRTMHWDEAHLFLEVEAFGNYLFVWQQDRICGA